MVKCNEKTNNTIRIFSQKVKALKLVSTGKDDQILIYLNKIYYGRIKSGKSSNLAKHFIIERFYYFINNFIIGLSFVLFFVKRELTGKNI